MTPLILIVGDFSRRRNVKRAWHRAPRPCSGRPERSRRAGARRFDL